LENLSALVEAANDSRLRLETIKNLLFPYRNPSPFSPDLVKKAHAQVVFIDLFHEMGWLKPPFETLNLEAAITAYQEFLEFNIDGDYASVDCRLDLVWHTHQLLGDAYRKETIELVGNCLDHQCKDAVADTADAYEQKRLEWLAERAKSKIGRPSQGSCLGGPNCPGGDACQHDDICERCCCPAPPPEFLKPQVLSESSVAEDVGEPALHSAR